MKKKMNQILSGLNEVNIYGNKDVLIDGIANGVLDDMPIWDHKSYVADPILCDGDGPINKFRKWVSQFYSEPLQN